MENKMDGRPENMDDIYSKEVLEYLCQYKIRSKIIRVLKENFSVKEVLVISDIDKKNENVKVTDKLTKQ